MTKPEGRILIFALRNRVQGRLESLLEGGFSWRRFGAYGSLPCTNPNTEEGAVTQIVEVAIHPAIGIARVSNSPTDWFYGPEAPGAVAGACEEFSFKDAHGRIKRQAARFRVYAHGDDGSVRELIHGDGVEIRWTVHVANTKAAWYEAINAMDLPGLGQTSQRRNKNVTTDRRQLEIDAGPHNISGRCQRGDEHLLVGRFMDTDVALGEIRTDEKGRLVFLGGFVVARDGPKDRDAPDLPGSIYVETERDEIDH